MVTKKNRLKGLSGTANMNAGTYGRYGVGFLATYTKKKWSLFFGGDYSSERPGYESSERVTTKNDTTYFTRSEGDRNRTGTFGLSGGDSIIFFLKTIYSMWNLIMVIEVEKVTPSRTMKNG